MAELELSEPADVMKMEDGLFLRDFPHLPSCNDSDNLTVQHQGIQFVTILSQSTEFRIVPEAS